MAEDAKTIDVDARDVTHEGGPSGQGQEPLVEPEGRPIGFDDMVQSSGGQGLQVRPPDDLVAEDDEAGHEISSQFRTWTATPKFKPGDLVYPRLRIAQPTTPEVAQNRAKGGQFVMTGHEPQDMVTLIPLMFASARELRPKGQLKKVLCQSKDALVGVPVIPPGPGDQYGGNCEACPKSHWSGPQGNRTGPPCNLIYSYICWSVQHGQIIVIEFKNTSRGAGNFLNVNFDSRGSGNFAVNMSTQQQTNSNQQTYYVPVVTFAKVDDEVFARARSAIM